MSAAAITVMAGLILCYALVARRLTLANLTAPMLSVLAGVLVFSFAKIDIDASFVHNIAELTLIIILFHDASTVKLSKPERCGLNFTGLWNSRLYCKAWKAF